MSEIDAREFRTVLGQFCTGVVIATGCMDGEPAGFAEEAVRILERDMGAAGDHFQAIFPHLIDLVFGNEPGISRRDKHFCAG